MLVQNWFGKKRVVTQKHAECHYSFKPILFKFFLLKKIGVFWAHVRSKFICYWINLIVMLLSSFWIPWGRKLVPSLRKSMCLMVQPWVSNKVLSWNLRHLVFIRIVSSFAWTVILTISGCWMLNLIFLCNCPSFPCTLWSAYFTSNNPICLASPFVSVLEFSL